MSTTEFGWPSWAGGAGGGSQGASFSSIAYDFLWWATAGGMIYGLYWRLFGNTLEDQVLDPILNFLSGPIIEENLWVGPGVVFYVK